ncbi:MAG: MarR family transcriptional regulator [Actinobacteria bacterium]|nr:MarR family transcriptional regulator [Actinomycetota bacterium]
MDRDRIFSYLPEIERLYTLFDYTTTLWEAKELSLYHVDKVEFYLLLIMRFREDLRMKDMAELLSLNNSTLTQVANRCERKGLIKREKGKEDRRETILKFTPKGRKLINSIVSHRQALFFPVWEKVSDEDIKGFLNVLRTVVETLEDRVALLERLKRPW